MIRRVCDICGEVIEGNFKLVGYEWNEPEFYVVDGNNATYDEHHESKDICPNCWAEIYNFATRFKKDPHIHIVTDEEYQKL